MKKIIEITENFITLGQLLKIENIISSGGMAKWYLENNSIYINGELEKRRGKKLFHGYIIELENKDQYIIKQINVN